MNAEASIISISQNDNGQYCQSAEEMAIIEAEGSPMGPMLRAVNEIARRLGLVTLHAAYAQQWDAVHFIDTGDTSLVEHKFGPSQD